MTTNIGAAQIAKVRLAEQAGDPAAPASGYAYVYAKADGLYLILSAGTVIGPLAVKAKRQFTWTVSGVLTAAAGTLRVYNHSGASLTISGVYIAANTAPTGAAIIVDVHLSGTTIFTTQSNRPQIAASANEGSSTTIENAALANGAYLTVDVDQIGSTIAGSDLTVTVVAS